MTTNRERTAFEIRQREACIAANRKRLAVEGLTDAEVEQLERDITSHETMLAKLRAKVKA